MKQITLPTKAELPAIEHGVPFPAPAQGKSSVKPVLEKMKVGDSVVVPRNKRTSYMSVAWRNGWQVTTRLINDTEIRVWRIK